TTLVLPSVGIIKSICDADRYTGDPRISGFIRIVECRVSRVIMYYRIRLLFFRDCRFFFAG
ncbi:hypothetical protein GJM54_RS25655, partial [Escherichia coli]